MTRDQSVGRVKEILLTRHQHEMPTTPDEATAIIRKLLDDKELWFELEAISLELNDQLDEMNDALRNLEAAFRSRRFRPGWVPMPDGSALIWNGVELLYDTGKFNFDLNRTVQSLLHSNKERRTRSLAFIGVLVQELERPRAIAEGG